MTNAIFGPLWDAPVCDDPIRIKTPTGTPCGWCQVPVEDGDSGIVMPYVREDRSVEQMPMHKECNLRSVTGNPKHLRGECHHVGDCQPEGPQTPAEMRAEAIEVWNMLTRRTDPR